MDEQKLKEYFKFDETDLQTNRTGQFSEKQIEYLTQAGREFDRDMRRTAIPFVLAAAVGILSAILGRSIGWGWILGWGVGWTLLWGLIGWGFIEGSFTKRKFKLGQVKGRVKVALKEGGYSFKKRETYTWGALLVGNKRFEVQTDLNKLITRGDEYIVYYEKSSNKIVSLEFVSAAERLAPDAERISNVDFAAEAKKLRKHFDFTEADLMTNQNGTLSEKQINRSVKEEKGGKTIGVLFGAFLLVFPIVFAPLVLSSMKGLTQMKDVFGFWILWAGMELIFGLVLLLLGGAGIFLIVSQFIGKAKFKLLSVRGRANLIKGYGNRRSHVYYDLNINGHQFDGDGSMPNAIIQDAEYVVYYLEGSERIMSVELVSAM